MKRSKGTTIAAVKQERPERFWNAPSGTWSISADRHSRVMKRLRFMTNGLIEASIGLSLLFCAAGPTLADDAAVEAGRALVEMYCTDCHATDMSGESPLADAPRFRDLHLRYDVELLSEALVEGIVTAHPDMPQFEFDPDQAAAIIAYLKTLESAQASPSLSINDED